MAFQLVYLSQQDPQWKNDLLGFGDPGDTIGMYGCALTSVAMLVSGHGYSETPKTLNQKLKAANGFVSSGIRWDVVNKVHPQITLKENIPCENTDAPLSKIDAALAAGQPVVVRVDSSPAPGLQWHYVMVYARKGNDYLMLDPYPYTPGTAKEDLLMARYSRGNPLQRSIQQILIYQCSTSGGTISTPSGSSTTTTPSPVGQSTTGTSLGTGPHARVMAEVTWGLNIRSSTDTSSLANLVVNVPAGTELALTEANAESKIGVQGQWVRVRTAQGQEGFAAAWYLEKVAGTTPTPVTESAPSPVNEAPASSTSTPATQSTPSPVTETPTSSSTTPAAPSSTPSTLPPAPEPPKVQVVVKAAGTKIYNSASAAAAVITTEKAGARLTVVEAVDAARAKVGIKGKRINVKASNGKRGFVDGDKVKLP
jgi:peptidase C39-like protein